MKSLTIKLYKASNFSYTPFNDYMDGDLNYLNNNNIVIVAKPSEADIIISQNFKHLRNHFWRTLFGKKFLIWTIEPRFNTSFKKNKNYFFGLFKCSFMNIYTQDIFVSNISVHCKIINEKLISLPSTFQISSNKIISLMSYYSGVNADSLYKNGENIDLIALRSRIAIEGSKENIIDVYGKGWPEGISKEDSRDGDWRTSKKIILDNYNFNLCFENTASPNYMTEKIWDSIENYCLPIYYAKNTNAYQIFPKDSFIDYSDFNKPQELFDFVLNISNEEFIRRMNRCIEVYNSISIQGETLVKSERKKTLDRIVERINEITHN
ncbi:Glycosyl transferase family 10 [Flavobacteriaceae bacterium]